MTPPGSVGGVDAVTDRTSTQGPPMLDASPVPVVAEPMPVIEEPTELLPPPFEEPAAYSFPARPFEPDVPARQSPELASGQALRIVDTPAERLSAAPASGPHPRSANVWIIVALGVLVAILLGVVIGMAASTSTQSAEVERQPSVAGLGSEQPSASTIEPQTESTPPQTIPGPPSTGPETAPPVATVADDPPPPVTTGTDDSTGGETDSTEELEDVENPGKPDVKPKPKPKPPSTKVLFMIAGGTPDAQISVGGRSHAYNGYFAQTSLRSGKSHEIRWRSNADKPWHTPGALKVEVLDPGTYYEVHLTATAISVKTKKEGSG